MSRQTRLEHAEAVNANREAAADARRDDRQALVDALAEARERAAALRDALYMAGVELGVPQPGYPQPVANAAAIIRAALDSHGKF